MTYLFKPPTVEEGPAGFGRLFWRYRITRANTIIVNGTTVTSERTPGVDELSAATYYYIGGHEAILTTVEYNILIAAGYSSNITII
jgi:hypothetical protein